MDTPPTTPTKLEITQIKEGGKKEVLGTLEWDGNKWEIISDKDLYYIKSMISYGVRYGDKKLSFNDRDLYLPLIRSRDSYLHFISV